MTAQLHLQRERERESSSSSEMFVFLPAEWWALTQCVSRVIGTIKHELCFNKTSFFRTDFLHGINVQWYLTFRFRNQNTSTCRLRGGWIVKSGSGWKINAACGSYNWAVHIFSTESFVKAGTMPGLPFHRTEERKMNVARPSSTLVI